MRTARLHGVGDLRVAEEVVAVPGPGECLVRVTAVGLCGSDLHWFSEGGIGDAQLTAPLVIGHEFAGVIDGGPRHGERVAVDPAIPCRRCASCAAGHGNLCPQVRFAGHGGLDGALREYVAWPEHLLHPLPDMISDAGGALLEPLGVALHAFDLGHLRLGGTVAVVGCGPIGLLLVQLARLAGATRVVAYDPLPHRLAAAERFGASTDSGSEPGSAGDGVDVVFEVAGDDAAVLTGLQVVRPGGRVVLAGIPDDDRTAFPASLARRKGLTIALSRRMHNAYPRAIELVRTGRVDVESLVTHRFPLAETAEAFRVAVRRTGLKVVVEG